MKTFPVRVGLFILLGLAATHLGAAEPTEAEKAAAARMGSAVEQSGFRSKQFNDHVWAVYGKDKSGREWRVICGGNAEQYVIGIVVAEKKNMRLTDEAMRRLLKLSHESDHVKIGLDNDDDLFVRVELKTPWLDLDEFKFAVNQSIKAAEQAHEAIKPCLVQP